MVRGFVFGKFLPFHKGHEALINFGLSKCDLLSVLICCSDKENTSAEIRKLWIQNTFVNNPNLEILVYNYSETDLPNTSESSKHVSEIWGKVFKSIFPLHTLLFTSEPYGDFVAEFMNIKHIAFDISKTKFPVSGSFIGKNLFKYWQFLPDSVKPYFIHKVVILGTESTGKTTLANNLAKYFDCSLVLESGRDIIADSNSFTIDELRVVAQEHANRINKSHLSDSPLVIIDTDIHTTLSYSWFTFNQGFEVSKEIYNSNKADLYLFLKNDVEFIQDGTRLNEEERNLLDISHRKILNDHQIPFIEIEGNWEKRFTSAINEINKIISS